MAKKIHRTIPWDDESFERQRARKAALPENTTYGAVADVAVRRDMMILTCMLWLPLDALQHEHEFEIAPETADHIHRGFEVMVKNMPPHDKEVVARKILADAALCLRATESPGAKAAALAAAHLIVKLTDEGLIRDATSNVVLAALGIVHEAAQDGPTGPWGYREGAVVQASQRLWDRAQLAGYLLTMTPGFVTFPQLQ